jgi:hypothetical protein
MVSLYAPADDASGFSLRPDDDAFSACRAAVRAARALRFCVLVISTVSSGRGSLKYPRYHLEVSIKDRTGWPLRSLLYPTRNLYNHMRLLSRIGPKGEIHNFEMLI